MPLYVFIARKNFRLQMIVTIIGGTATAGNLGIAAGPFAGD